MAILLLTVQHWTFEVAAFPIFIVCMASVEVVLVGFEPGPRWRRARHRDRIAGRTGAHRDRARATARLLGTGPESRAEGSRAVPTAHVNGIDIEYVTEGDRPTRPCSSSWGSARQLITWPRGFVDGLRERGFFVIRFDNRDCGLSTKFEGLPEITALFSGDTSSAPYRVEDMADDAAASAHRARHRARPRRRRLDGRHDHPGARDQPPGALLVRLLHHVDDGRPVRGCPHRRGDDARSCGPWRRAARRPSRPAWPGAGSSVRRSTRRTKRPARAGRRRVRPLLLPRRHGPPAGRHPRLARPHRGAPPRPPALPRRPRRGRPAGHR